MAYAVVSPLPPPGRGGLAGKSRSVSVVKLPSGKFRAKLKVGRVDVASRVFPTKAAAQAWLDRERAAIDGGIDPRAGKRLVKQLVTEWLEVRRHTVAVKTARADQDVQRLTPTSVLNLQVKAVTGREIARVFVALLSDGLAESSVRRYRASLSSFFGWCVQEKIIATNPVAGVQVPKSSAIATEMLPFSEDELEDRHAVWLERDERLADVLLVLGWTGLRWGEARALQVRDLVEVPAPALLIRRSAPEGVPVKATKGRRSRRVPIANRVLDIVRSLAESRAPGDPLLTTAGGSLLHRSAVLRTLDWRTTSDGRRLHDLRHTAACLWLARGVDPGTVQAWMGHESIATTNRYLHHLGTGADMAGLARLNEALGGTRGAHSGQKAVLQAGDLVPEMSKGPSQR